MFKVPDQHRIRNGAFGTTPEYGNNGAFKIPYRGAFVFKVIASDGAGWEHVSVTTMLKRGGERCPKWEEMAFIKSLFWDDDDLVVQYMVPADDHVNFAQSCLHLWRKCGTNDFCERPSSILVGPPSKEYA